MLCDWLFCFSSVSSVVRSNSPQRTQRRSIPMSTRPTIMKFGGTSVEDSAAFRNVARIVHTGAGARPVVVVSAIGGFTNALLSSVEIAIAGDARAATKPLDIYLERHVAIANDLLRDESCTSVESAVDDARREIRQLHKIIAAHPVTHPPLQDEIIAYGEQLSSRLLAAVLRENGLSARCVEARRCIKTDDNYGSAAPLPETQRATHVELVPLIE